MKKTIGILLGCLCILLLESGVKRIEKKPALTITPSRLQLFVDQHTDPYTIKIVYTLNIPHGFIPSCARMVYQPYFLSAGHRYDLTPLVVSGKNNLRQEKRLTALTDKQPDYPEALRLISEGEGMQVRLSETVPFELWMAQATLRADVTLEACDREKHIEVLTLADGVIWLPMGPGPVRVKYAKERVMVQKVSEFEFFFPSGQYIFNREYDGNASSMKRMMKLVDSFRSDSTMRLEKLVIAGSSSPIGTATFNASLAEQRAEQMKQRLVERKQMEAQEIELEYIGENWAGLRQLVEQSKLPDKAAVLRILDTTKDAAQRKASLKQLPQYEYLRINLYPDLQEVRCIFYYTQKEEITKVIPE